MLDAIDGVMETTGSIKTSVKLNADQLAALDRHAQEQGSNRSDLIRAAIEERYQRTPEEGTAPAEPRKTRISDIAIGERRREDYGDLSGLAGSIAHYGLIHPIVIDAENRLVAGGRRLMACLKLGHQEIETRSFGDLTEAERREIELEENLRRKDLTPYEQARDLVRKAPIVAEAISSKFDEKAPQGRPSAMAAPKADVAQALGVSKGTLVNAEQHVATAEAYPFMQKPDWKQDHVLKARELLKALPEQERELAADIVSEPGVPPTLALSMLARISCLAEAARHELFQDYLSTDPRDHERAMTWAAEREPTPDPRVLILKECIRELRRANRIFPNDPEVPQIEQCALDIERIVEAVRERRKVSHDGAAYTAGAIDGKADHPGRDCGDGRSSWRPRRSRCDGGPTRRIRRPLS